MDLETFIFEVFNDVHEDNRFILNDEYGWPIDHGEWPCAARTARIAPAIFPIGVDRRRLLYTPCGAV